MAHWRRGWADDLQILGHKGAEVGQSKWMGWKGPHYFGGKKKLH